MGSLLDVIILKLLSGIVGAGVAEIILVAGLAFAMFSMSKGTSSKY